MPSGVGKGEQGLLIFVFLVVNDVPASSVQTLKSQGRAAVGTARATAQGGRSERKVAPGRRVTQQATKGDKRPVRTPPGAPTPPTCPC